MELFNKEGHLTDEGLRAVVDGTLDEMGRLEASEHLSFCDSCLVRYTELLADDTLLVPEMPLTPTVLARVRRRAVRVFFNRYTRVAAVAAFAVVLWGTGVFNSLVPDRTIRQQEPARITAPISAATRVNDFFRSAGDSISAAITNILPRADAAPARRWNPTSGSASPTRARASRPRSCPRSSTPTSPPNPPEPAWGWRRPTPSSASTAA